MIVYLPGLRSRAPKADGRCSGALDGAQLTLEELHRFPNTPVRVLDSAALGRAAPVSRNPARTGDRRAGPAAGSRWDRNRYLGRGFRLAWRGWFAVRQSAALSRFAQQRDAGKGAGGCAARRDLRQTGIQFMQINTLIQLYAMRAAGDPALDSRADAADDAGSVQLLAHRRRTLGD